MASLNSPSHDKKVLCEECNNEWKLVKKLSTEEIEDKISRYLNTPVQLRGYIIHVPSRQSQLLQSSSLPLVLERPISDVQIHYNAIVQKAATAKKKNLHDHIYSCIEFGEADAQRRREIIKVRTINHLRSSLEKKYNEYLSRTTTRNYILPRNNRMLSAKAHHHTALVGIA
ncbi:15850_t:CDS:2, partial [Gigaspora rosea]